MTKKYLKSISKSDVEVFELVKHTSQILTKAIECRIFVFRRNTDTLNGIQLVKSISSLVDFFEDILLTQDTGLLEHFDNNADPE